MAFMQEENKTYRRMPNNMPGVGGPKKKKDYKDMCHATVDHHLEFDSISSVMYITDINFCKKFINPIFKKIFSDYFGSIIEANPNTGEAELVLYFKGDPEAKVDENKNNTSANKKFNALYCINTSRSDSFSDQLAAITQLGKRMQRAFLLTEEAEEMISDFIQTKNNMMPDYYNSNNPLVIELPNNTNLNNSYNTNILVQVRGLSLNNICRMIFGSRLNGNHIEYNALIQRKTPTPYQNNSYGVSTRQSYILKIENLVREELDNLSKEIGYMPTTMGVPVVEA